MRASGAAVQDKAGRWGLMGGTGVKGEVDVGGRWQESGGEGVGGGRAAGVRGQISKKHQITRGFPDQQASISIPLEKKKVFAMF